MKLYAYDPSTPGLVGREKAFISVVLTAVTCQGQIMWFILYESERLITRATKPRSSVEPETQ